LLSLCLHCVVCLHIRHEQTPKQASLIPEHGLVCFQGPADQIFQTPRLFSPGPLAGFSPHSGALQSTCEELGYPESLEVQDSCWPFAIMHFKANSNKDLIFEQLRKQSLAMVNDYADSHNIDREFAMKWTACDGCYAGVGKDTTFRWVGADRQYSKEECATIKPDSAKVLREARRKTGALVPNTGFVCFEGAFDYMEDVLSHTKGTPFEDLFNEKTVEETTCAKLGYDEARDARDECWPEASKHVRSAANMQELIAWVVGPEGTREQMKKYDQSHGLPEGTAVDRVTCGVCGKGSTNYDRGMMYTLDGSISTDRYSEEFCMQL